jgi:hypothetical protein
MISAVNEILEFMFPSVGSDGVGLGLILHQKSLGK